MMRRGTDDEEDYDVRTTTRMLIRSKLMMMTTMQVPGWFDFDASADGDEAKAKQKQKDKERELEQNPL
jgi:hypothetical protein